MSEAPRNWLSKWQWEPATAPLTNGSDDRNPSALVRVVAQFTVETHERYRPGKPGPTWCNIFTWDVTRALACEVPHWIKGKETNANDLVHWLEGKLTNGGKLQGPDHGWRPIARADVRARARAGIPCLVTYENPNPSRPGHIAVVMPAGLPDGDDLQIAQAGATCFSYGPVAQGFGTLPVKFWTHD